ncbi:MAG: tyrosine--tRNA ligase [Thermoplasmataceae archaeon]|jgi:tyrosyl-tRNA synthetase
MDKYELLTRNTSEVVTEEEAKKLLNENPSGYIGFEPSGLPHIAMGIMWPLKIRDAVEAGIDMTVLLADWHAFINDKLGSDMERIRSAGIIFEETLKRMGVPASVKFLWASEVIDKPEYWQTLLKIAKHANLKRIVRALPIMGRSEDDANKDFSKYIYPLMQVTDIAFLDFDLAMGGMDQRHAHMLSRDLSDRMGTKKVVAIHAPLISSLKGSGRMDPGKTETSGQDIKMSKSDPNSAIFMFDNPTTIRKKINSSFCPPGVIQGNPIIDIAKYIIFPRMDSGLTIDRPIEKGGVLHLATSDDLLKIYSENKIHPVDLKNTVTEALVEIMKPAADLPSRLSREIKSVSG